MSNYYYLQGSSEGSLDILGLEVGETVSAAMQVKSETGADQMRAVMEFYDSSDTLLQTNTSSSVTTSSYQRVTISGISIPSNTSYIELYSENQDDTEQGYSKRAVFNQGDKPKAYSDPSIRGSAQTPQFLEASLTIDRDSNILSDNSALNSKDLQFTGYYDFDSSSSIDTRARTFTIRNTVDYAGATGEYRLSFINDSLNEIFTVEGDTERVGIGATQPDRKLDLEADGRIRMGDMIEMEDDSTADDNYRLFVDLDGFKLQQMDGSYSIVGTTMTLDHSGNVGIGTTSPGADLQLGSGSNRREIRYEYNPGTSDTALGLFNFNWNGTQVARVQGESGPDTTNKDDGILSFWTATGGTLSEVVRVDENGNVGIGTSSPTELLHTTGYLRADGGSPTDNQVLTWNGTDNRYEPSDFTSTPGGDDGDVQYNNGGTTAGAASLQWDDTNARLGIRTTSPVEALHISGASAHSLFSADSGAIPDNGSLNSPYLRLRGYYDSDSTTSTTATSLHVTIRNVVDYNSAAGAHRLAFENDAGTEFVTFDGDDARVGVGVTSPGQKLEVAGNIRANSGNAKLVALGGTGDFAGFIANNTDEAWRFETDGGTGFQIKNDTNGNFLTVDQSLNVTFPSSDVYFTGNQVGIGTSSPSELLHVSGGNIRLDVDPDQFEFHSDASKRDLYWVYDKTDGQLKWQTRYWGGSSGEGLEFRDDVNNRTVLFLERSSGNVGVGTTSPSEALNVIGRSRVKAGGSTHSAGTWYEESGGGQEFFVGLTGDSSTANFRIWHNSPKNIIELTDDGYVGIGTTPSRRLEVFSGDILLNRSSGDVTDNSSVWSYRIDLRGYYDTDSTSSVVAGGRTIGIQNKVEYAGSSGEYRLAFINDGGTEFVTFEGDTQRVGIGTKTPSYTLTVNGEFQADASAGIIDNAASHIVLGGGSGDVRLTDGSLNDQLRIQNAGGINFAGVAASNLDMDTYPINSVDYVEFVNHEQGDIDADGYLYWDLSEGLYIKSSNSSSAQTGGDLLWSHGNFTASTGLSVSYDSNDRPTMSINSSVPQRGVNESITGDWEFTGRPAFKESVDPSFVIGPSYRGSHHNGAQYHISTNTSDYGHYQQGGHGRVMMVWNAEWENSNNNWESIVGSEPHSSIGLSNSRPNDGGEITLAAAPSNSSAGDVVSWNIGLEVHANGAVEVRTGVGGTGPNSDGAVRNIVHHGTNSASAVGIEGTLHTENL